MKKSLVKIKTQNAVGTILAHDITRIIPEKSKGAKNGIFYGLMIDVENQDNLTDERVNNWVKEIKKSFV